MGCSKSTTIFRKSVVEWHCKYRKNYTNITILLCDTHVTFFIMESLHWHFEISGLKLEIHIGVSLMLVCYRSIKHFKYCVSMYYRIKLLYIISVLNISYWCPPQDSCKMEIQYSQNTCLPGDWDTIGCWIIRGDHNVPNPH